MKEPEILWPSQGIVQWTPYSVAPAKSLAFIAAGGGTKSPTADEWFCPDFRRRYAAILLRERGL